MDWYNYILYYFLPITIPTVLFFIFKKYFGGIIDKTFTKEIETYKQKLSIATEEVRFDHQRKIQNYNIYIQNKHTAYSKLQELLLIADSRVGSLFGGIVEQSTYEEYNEEDFKYLMETNNFSKGKINEILIFLKTDRKIAINNLRSYLRLKEFSDSKYAISDAYNQYLLSRFYLSKEVDDIAKELIDKLRRLQHNYSMMERLPYEREERKDFSDKSGKLNIEISNLLHNLINLMKTELELGHKSKNIK